MMYELKLKNNKLMDEVTPDLNMLYNHVSVEHNRWDVSN